MKRSLDQANCKRVAKKAKTLDSCGRSVELMDIESGTSWYIHVYGNQKMATRTVLKAMRGQTKRQTKPSAPMMALPNWIKKRGASSLEMDDDVHTHAKKTKNNDIGNTSMDVDRDLVSIFIRLSL
ncbi:uncharacterized protein LOC128187884 [Crassostrea angulata]|uniref:uncharacterized protein LOC128187884 n=1 Tax=Magallana angulata TaxID=2784310 RepID=UPI0022B1651B|nr:uncharacterized protein LOC128187884 [Crassostrea angulata]